MGKSRSTRETGDEKLIRGLSLPLFQESSVSEVKSSASGNVKYATLGGHTEAQRKKDAKKLEKEARFDFFLVFHNFLFH